MEKDIDFLLRYAKDGVLQTMAKLDEIEAEELKMQFIDIRKRLSGTEVKEEVKTKTTKKEGGAMAKWFKGIGGRAKAYEEAHKGEL